MSEDERPFDPEWDRKFNKWASIAFIGLGIVAVIGGIVRYDEIKKERAVREKKWAEREIEKRNATTIEPSLTPTKESAKMGDDNGESKNVRRNIGRSLGIKAEQTLG